VITAKEMEMEIKGLVEVVVDGLHYADTEQEMRNIGDAILSRLKMLELAQVSCVAEQAYRHEDEHGESEDLSDLDITWTDARLAWLAEYLRQKGQNEQG
jgi:hypothetical protein